MRRRELVVEIAFFIGFFIAVALIFFCMTFMVMEIFKL